MGAGENGVDHNAGRKQGQRSWHSSKIVPLFRRAAGLAIAVVGLSWGYMDWSSDYGPGAGHYRSGFVNWDARREQVKQAFVTSWEAYTTHAWGALLTSCGISAFNALLRLAALQARTSSIPSRGRENR